jgi:hypothetical protein
MARPVNCFQPLLGIRQSHNHCSSEPPVRPLSFGFSPLTLFSFHGISRAQELNHYLWPPITVCLECWKKQIGNSISIPLGDWKICESHLRSYANFCRISAESKIWRIYSEFIFLLQRGRMGKLKQKAQSY